MDRLCKKTASWSAKRPSIIFACSTSPSIYVKFQTLQASDACGPIGLTDSILSTIVAFDPGELSTFIGSPEVGATRISAFNVADLPCPPQSIMVCNRDRQELMVADLS